MEIIKLSKMSYSTIIIRKTLYWLKEGVEWNMDEDENNWYIKVKNSDTFDKEYFDKLLNDNILRFEIDKNTLNLREQIIIKALKKTYEAL